MKKTLSRILSIFLLSILLLISITPNYALAEIQIVEENPKADLVFFEDILKLIKESYPFDIEEDKLIEAAVKGMLKSIDPYSDYYTKEEAESKFSTITGTFSGIGIYIEEKEGYINIVNTIKNQPAEKSGLKKDDLIISVEDIDIKDLGLDKVSSMIKGPKGTKVKIGIKRGEKLLTFEVTRDTITINPVSYEILENNIGYIQIEDFNSQVTIEVKRALKALDAKGITKIILDLRDNPGGLLNEVIDTAKLFVPRGAIVHVRNKNQPLITHTSTLVKSKYKLVVLVNENSASASEILAGAIKDRRVGTLVGTKTFGKGIIQSLITVNDGSIVKLTTAEYLTPNKTSIHGKGIEPNITITNTEKDTYCGIHVIRRQYEKIMEISFGISIVYESGIICSIKFHRTRC